MLRTTLSAIAVTALAGAALSVPSTASAATDGGLSWTVQDHTVLLTTATEGVVDFSYVCGTAGAATTLEVDPGVFQPVYAGAKAQAFDETGNYPSFDCDGTRHTQAVTFKAVEGTFENGSGEVGLIVNGKDGDPTFEHVVIKGLDDDRAEVEVSVNASPEPVKKGKTITVRGSVLRDGKAYSKKKATLYFAADDKQAKKVKTVTTSTKGALKTTVKAKRSGTFFWTTTSTSKTQAGASAGDRVALT